MLGAGIKSHDAIRTKINGKKSNTYARHMQKKKRKKREQSSPIVKNLILAENLYEGFLVFQSAHALFGSRINLVIASRIRKLASLYII